MRLNCVRTHCANGHELSPENITMFRDQVRCRACGRAAALRYLDKKNPDRIRRPVSRGPVEARYWAKVDRRGTEECWRWTGAINTAVHPKFRIRGKARPASWVALEFDGRPRPFDGALACHTCDNPICVNPAHLWWGTQTDNMADMAAKGRHPLHRNFKEPAPCA